MYYYSNNYSKYIENLKLEKSRIAFQKLVEDSRENKNPDIRIKEVVSSKDSDSITKEFGIASKDNDSLSYEGELPEKSRNKIDSENVVKSKKSTNKISVDDSLSSKSGDEINNESSFSDIEPNDVEYNINESEKLYSAITGENEQSSKNEQDVSTEGALSDKFGNNINIEEQNSNKTENELNEIHPGSSKARTNLNKQNTFNSKSNSNLLKENPLSSKTTADIIKDIKNEKKKEGMFADVITDSKKESNLILERGYQYFLIDPKDYESMMYERNARHGYYPAGSYSEIDSKQKGAIDDLVGTISNENNWNGGGNIVVSSIKAATDIIDMVNLVGPSKNIYSKSEVATELDKHSWVNPAWVLDTANHLRWDLRIGNEYSNDKKNDDFSEYHQRQNDGGYSIVNGFDVGEKKDDDDDTIPKKNEIAYIFRLEYSYKQKNITEAGNQSVSFKLVKGRKTFKSYESREEYINSLKKYDDAESKRIDVKNQGESNYSGDDYEEIELISDGEDGSEYGISVDNRKPPIYVRQNTEDGVDNDFLGQEYLTNRDDDSIRKDIFDAPVDVDVKKDEDKKIQPEADENFLSKKYLANRDDKDFNFSYNRKSGIKNLATESAGEENRWYDRENSPLGHIYIIPPDYELNESSKNGSSTISSGNKAFSIPLQNNLTFEQLSRAATWTSIPFFGRIGDVQQYSKTNNLDMINITTKYFVETDGSDQSYFTMAKLQDIEMMYKSLVLPASESTKYLYGDATNGNNYYYFTRPPLLNVVIGNPGSKKNEIGVNFQRALSENKPYFNLFTDIYTIPNTDEESGYNNEIYYKNFVATNVTIDKNLNDYNYYVEDTKYYDMTGFTVTLALLEIDENYLGSLPSFNNYNYTLQSRKIINNV